jgi:hypothetical protein
MGEAHWLARTSSALIFVLAKESAAKVRWERARRQEDGTIVS